MEAIRKLMAVVDEKIPTPVRDTDKPFLMPIEDVFSISGRGTVATGRIERGIVRVNDKLQIIGIRETRETVVTGVEMFKKLLDEGRAGENVGLLLRGVEKKDIERGMVLSAPGTCKPHTKFKGTVYVLTKDEGGRHKPFFTGYRPQFYFVEPFSTSFHYMLAWIRTLIRLIKRLVRHARKKKAKSQQCYRNLDSSKET